MPGMRWRIWKEKLRLVDAIKKLDDNKLAKETFNSHLDLGVRRLVMEVKEICSKIGLADIYENSVTKEEVKDALEIHRLKIIKEEMADKEKYTDIKNEYIRKPQQFLKEMNLEQCVIASRVKCQSVTNTFFFF